MAEKEKTTGTQQPAAAASPAAQKQAPQAQQRLSKKQKKRPAQNQQRANSDETPEQRRERQRQEKLAKASRDDYQVVSRKTFDTNDFIALLNFNDNLVSQMRSQAGPGRKLTFVDLELFTLRSNILKGLFNSFNADACKKMNYRYTQPRGIDAVMNSIPADSFAKIQTLITEIAKELFLKTHQASMDLMQTPASIPPVPAAAVASKVKTAA